VNMVRKAKNRGVVVNIARNKQKTKRSSNAASGATAIGKALRTLGAAGGSAIGTYFGNPVIGATAGKGLGSLISKWMGQGDYSVVENSIVKASARGTDSIPAMHRTGQSITIRHKEFVTQVTGSTNFEVQRSLSINPGNPKLFPWLSSMAAKFEQYRIKGLVFHYVPTSGHAVSSTNPAIGAVMFQTSYRSTRDPASAAPTSKMELLNEYWACEAAPCDAFCHPIECAPTENPFQVHYVRTGGVPTDDSPLMYDYGVTYIATSGMPANLNVVGDIWVTYEIELLKPVLVSPAVDSHLDGYLYTSGAGSSAANMFGDTSINSTGSLRFSASNQTIVFSQGTLGTFQIVLALTGLASASNYFIESWNLTHCEADYFPDRVSTDITSATSTTANTAVALTRVKITDPNASASVRLTTTSAWSGLYLLCLITPV